MASQDKSWEQASSELEGHAEAGRWADAAASLMDLAQLEPDAEARARYLDGAALIYRDKIGDEHGAAALLEAAVEENPRFEKAWSALHRLHFALPAADPGGAEARRRCYGRALRRLGQEADRALRARLWQAVAAASDDLGDGETASAAREAAQALAPEEPTAPSGRHTGQPPPQGACP